MGVLANRCNANYVFSFQAPWLTHLKNVDASNDEGCIGVYLLCSNKINGKGDIKSCRYMISMKIISPVIQFKSKE